MKNKKVITLLLVLSIFLFISCNDEQTTNLIDTSTTSAKLLSQYYDDLIKFSIETWELEAFNSSLREIDFPIETQNEYQKTIKYLEARKKMVDTFAKVLPLLDNFLKNKSNETLKETLTTLGNNINELKPLKDNSVIVPSTIFGNLANDIVEMIKFFEIRSISKTLVATLNKMNELFVKESELYKSIVDERNNKSLTVINYMIDNELVIPWSLIQSAPGTVGLDTAVSKTPAKDIKAKAALKKVLEVKYYRMKYLTVSANEELQILLSDLIKTYNDFIDGKKVAFDNIAYVALRTSEYFSDINKYYQTLREGKNYQQTTDLIYHGNSESKIFHQPNCPYYNSKNCDVMFSSRDNAVSKGYSPCITCNP